MKTTHLLIGLAALAFLASCATTVQLSSSNSQRFQDGIYYTKPNRAETEALRAQEDAEVAALVSETRTSEIFDGGEEVGLSPDFASATLSFETTPTTVNIFTVSDISWWTPYSLSFSWGIDPWYYNNRYRPYYAWYRTRYYDYWYWRDYDPWYYSWYSPWYYDSWHYYSWYDRYYSPWSYYSWYGGW